MTEQEHGWIHNALAELNEKLSHHGGSASITGYGEDGTPIVSVEHPTLDDESWRAREAIYSDWAERHGLT